MEALKTIFEKFKPKDMLKRFFVFTTGMAMLFSCGNNAPRQGGILPVKTEVQRIEALSSSQDHLYNGTIAEEEGVELSFTSGGTLAQVNVRNGDYVRKGACIAVVDSTFAVNQLRLALSQLSQAQDAYSRMKGMYQSGSLPEMQWVEAQNQLASAQAQERMVRKALEDTRLLAPFSGYVSGADVRVGQNIGAGMPVAKVLRIERVKAKFTVPESEAALLRKGDEVSVVVSSAGGRTFPGRISTAGVEADPLTHAFGMTATVDNPSRDILPGMFCQVSVRGKHQSRIVIPSQAVCLGSDNRSCVWLVSGGRAKRRMVTVGGEDRLGVWISEGLSDGDSLIVKGQQKVSEGSPVEAL